MKQNKHIQTLKFKKCTWHNITRTTKKEMSFLQENFGFAAENIENCLPPLQRPKIIKYPNYIFMILLFPYYDRKRREIKISEIDFFISHNQLITVHDKKLAPMIALFKKYSQLGSSKNFGVNTVELVHEIIADLLNYCFPMLNHLGLEVDTVEEHIFDEQGEENVREILVVKRNIINFRKSMQAHKNVLKKLSAYLTFFSNNENIMLFFENLIEQTRDIWDLLENYKETIDALYNSNESLVSLRLSEIMKMLTIISVVTFPLTLFVALFSTNLLGTPFANHPFGFWIVVSLIFAGGIFMLYAFKSKRWF